MARERTGERALLPLTDPPRPTLRADAARNRAKILDAAAELFAARGLDRVSLDDVVAAAGVGKGTLFRIFGDKGGLAAALLDDRERELQQLILSGPPPLGPGADPEARLAAFIRAYARYVAAHGTLVRMSQTSRPGGRFEIGSHGFWRSHLANLFAQAGTPTPQLAADVVLGALTGEQVLVWMQRDGRDAVWIGRHLATLGRRLMG